MRDATGLAAVPDHEAHRLDALRAARARRALCAHGCRTAHLQFTLRHTPRGNSQEAEHCQAWEGYFAASTLVSYAILVACWLVVAVVGVVCSSLLMLIHSFFVRIDRDVGTPLCSSPTEY